MKYNMKYIDVVIFVSLMVAVVASDTSCPDGSHCDEGSCCKTSNGYSCCPLDGGVCCDKGIYCCPQGMTCSLKEGICVSSFNMSLREQEIFPTENNQINNQINDQVCPDKRHKCSQDATCCPISSRDYGCCPYDRATCCSDDEHCCPHGSVCNTKTNQCERKASLTQLTNVYCPGDKQVCPEE